MASTQSNNLTRKRAAASGTFELPALLKYPQPLDFNEKSIKDRYCYVIEDYGRDGISILIAFDDQSNQFVVRAGDWEGRIFDLKSDDFGTVIAQAFMQKDVHKFMKTMRLMSFKQAQYYFAVNKTGIILVDIQLSMNKFASPGMVRDIFGKIYPTQSVGDIILKPSAFSLHHLPNNAGVIPFYMQLKR
jgi:hypothetical protein